MVLRQDRKREPVPLRVLIVDDNEDAAEMLALSLAALGHHVEMAFDAP